MHQMHCHFCVDVFLVADNQELATKPIIIYSIVGVCYNSTQGQDSCGNLLTVHWSITMDIGFSLHTVICTSKKEKTPSIQSS